MFEENHILLNLAAWPKAFPASAKAPTPLSSSHATKIPFKLLKDITYGCICANYCPKKDDPNRSRLTVAGDRLNVPGDCGTPTVNMVTVKLHLNSVILTKGACYSS